jgi:carotenoid cleavage dioxygenase
MVHDLSITERRAVIYDLPVVFDLNLALAGTGLPYHWDADYNARVGVIDKSGESSDVTWFDVEPCFVFHPLNAYDDGDDVVIDLVRHPSSFDTNRHGPNEGTPTLERWTLDHASGKAREERLDDRGQEFPRVDERVVGRTHRFGYSVGYADRESVMFKHDFAAGTTETRRLGASESGEAVFVPRTADAAEDDGWVISIVYDRARDASDLLFLDARNFTGEPAAAVHLPQRVPFGFHGNWIAD